MSSAPYWLLKARSGYRMGPGDAPQDHMFFDGLEDAETGCLMGAFAQEMADKKGYTREGMDNYAISSLKRAQRAIEQGHPLGSTGSRIFGFGHSDVFWSLRCKRCSATSKRKVLRLCVLAVVKQLRWRSICYKAEVGLVGVKKTGDCLIATTRFFRVPWGYLYLESLAGLHFFRLFVRQCL